MRYALLDDKRIEASKGLKGLCPACGSEVIAKCGERRIHHWAHVGTRNCDPWWEPETEWHRAWKNLYPSYCQEVVMTDPETSEKHIADVRNEHGLVIEFQHSYIDPDERRSREKFYKNMVWVVDGTRLKRDFTRFSKGIINNFREIETGVYSVDYPDEVFPAAWIESSVPVVLDFRRPGNEVNYSNVLWCLVPKKTRNKSVITIITPGRFVVTTNRFPTLFPVRSKKTQDAPNTQRSRPKTHVFDAKKGQWKKHRRW